MPFRLPRASLVLAVSISVACAAHDGYSRTASAPRIPNNALPSDPAGIPNLIERLRSLGDVPETGPYGAIDMRFSVLDRLRVITNQNPGRNARDWDAWYSENRHKAHEDWIREGFLQQGLPYSNPVDTAFARALLPLLDWQTVDVDLAYRQTTAMHVLARMPLDTLAPLLSTFAASPVSADRRAVLSALHERFGREVIALLRPLTRDPDIGVAENALRMLNANLRRDLPVPDSPAWRMRLGTSASILGMIDPETALLLTGRADDRNAYRAEVRAFHVARRRTLWTYRLNATIAGAAAVVGNRIYFVDDERVAHGISTRGQPIWTRDLAVDPDVNRLGPLTRFFNGHLFAVDLTRLHAIPEDGRASSYEHEEFFRDNLEVAADRLLAAVGGGPLAVIDAGGVKRRIDSGVRVRSFGASDDAVCVTGRTGDSRHTVLQCLDAVTLTERWRASLPEEGNGYEDVVINDGRVYALGQGRIVAFRVADGRRLWADNEHRGGSSFDPFGGAIAVTSHAISEWRNAESGETIARMPEEALSDSRIILLGDSYLLTSGRWTFEPRVSTTAGLMLATIPASVRALVGAQ